MGLLNWKNIERYNYKDLKLNVDLFMNSFSELYFKYINITPRSITSRLREVVVDFTKSNTSYIEQYIEKKDEFEHKYLSELECILNILDNFTYQEQYFFKGVYFNDISEAVIREQLQVSRNGLDHVKRSAIIKFALAFDMVDEKEKIK